jgi:hypothetical protein
MATVRLPISGMDVILQQPTGAEDTLLQEAPACNTALALELIARLAEPANGLSVEWGTLCVTDLEALLLLLRQWLFGDLIRSDVSCLTKDCGKRIDVAFRIGEYLAHHSPRTARGVEPADEAGWSRFRDVPVAFRLPSVADQIAVSQSPKPERELIRRCIQPAGITARMLKRVETAMEAQAPSLSHDLQGECPECGARVNMYFDVQQFTLRELRDQAVFIYEDVHLLAKHYHWSQAEILALPRSRRAHYIEMVQQQRSLV